MYRSRWDIEVFFKFIKYNYKFQHPKDKSEVDLRKMYICELIITYIAKIIKKYYMKHYPTKKSEKGVTYKINKSNLVDGIYDVLLYEILTNKLTEESLDKFCESYIEIIQNKDDRSFPRIAKTPFTKWYVKGYSNLTKLSKVINAIINNKVDKLKNKDLRYLARQIISIDGKKYN